MIRIETLLPRETAPRRADATLTLPFEMRRRSRLLLNLDDGEEAGLFIERGTVLADGDELRASDGRVVRVLAAREDVYRVSPTPDCSLARAAFHLGNRHIPVQLSDGFLRIERDAVLRTMLIGIGAQVIDEIAAFQPEPGAYGGGHRHGHDAGFAEEQELARSVFTLRHGGGSSPR